MTYGSGGQRRAPLVHSGAALCWPPAWYRAYTQVGARSHRPMLERSLGEGCNAHAGWRGVVTEKHLMEQKQRKNRRAEKLSRGARIIRLLGDEAKSISARLREVPEHLAIIDAMTDEASRREAKVVVRETRKSMIALGRELALSVATLEDIPGVRLHH